MTILSIVQDAAIRAGVITAPTSAVGSVDPVVGPTALLLVALARDAGRDALERANWVQLDIAAKVTGDGTTTLFTLPPDWDRFSPGDKSPNGALVSSKYPLTPLDGPVNTEDLNLLKALNVSIVRPVWRIIGGSLELFPAPALAEIITFNYYSSNWILAADGITRQSDWVADTDTSLINEDIIMKGALWRWLKSKGLDYADEFRAYEASLDRNASQQMTERIISTSRGVSPTGGDYFGTISYTPP